MPIATLRPTGDGSTGTFTRNPATNPFGVKLFDDPSSNDGDTTYVQGPNIADGSMFVTLSGVSGTFNPSNINSIMLRGAAKKIEGGVSQATDTVDLYLTLFRTDEVTQISNETTVFNVTDAVSYTLFSGVVALSGTHTLSDWQTVKMRIRQDYTAVQMGDITGLVRISAAAAIVDYTEAIPTIPFITSGVVAIDMIKATNSVNIQVVEPTLKTPTNFSYNIENLSKFKHINTGQFPMLPIIDDFNRPNEYPLGGGWSGPIYNYENPLQLVNGRVGGSGAGSASYWNIPIGPDVELYFTYGGSFAQEVFWGMTPEPTGAGWSGYDLVVNTSTQRIFRVDSAWSSNVQLTSFSWAIASGDLVGIRHIGTGIYVYHKSPTGAMRLIASHGHNTTGVVGYFGFAGVDETAGADNVGGGTLLLGDTLHIESLRGYKSTKVLDFENLSSNTENSISNIENLGRFVNSDTLHIELLSDYQRSRVLDLENLSNNIENRLFNIEHLGESASSGVTMTGVFDIDFLGNTLNSRLVTRFIPAVIYE
jgi:hypothetical protein